LFSTGKKTLDKIKKLGFLKKDFLLQEKKHKTEPL